MSALCDRLILLPTVLAALSVLLPGCGPEPSFEAVLAGKVALDPGDRQAVAQLLAGTSLEGRELRLLGPGETGTAAPPFVAIADGRVSMLALTGLRDIASLAALDALHELSLEGSFVTLDLAGLPRLTRLRIDSQGDLEKLELTGLLALEELLVHGARLQQSPDLGQSPSLRLLGLIDCGLQAIPRLEAPGLEDLALPGNRITDFENLAPLLRLERLQLSDNQLLSMPDLPALPRLRVLDLAGNPLGPETRIEAELFPALAALNLRRTAWRSPPPGLEEVPDLRLRLDEDIAAEVAFEQALAKLRQGRQAWAAERVAALPATGGTLYKSSGTCQWRVGSLHRARVSCQLSYSELRGLAAARLGETSLTLPYMGGGRPRIRITLAVGEGQAALYLRQEFDSIADAQILSGLDPIKAEALRLSEDRFSGYRQVVATPDLPAEATGEPQLLGSRVVLWIEATDKTARDLELTVEPL